MNFLNHKKNIKIPLRIPRFKSVQCCNSKEIHLGIVLLFQSFQDIPQGYSQCHIPGNQSKSISNKAEKTHTLQCNTIHLDIFHTYVANPFSMIPPNNTAVVCNSLSGYWGKNLYSSNKFLSIHSYTSWKYTKVYSNGETHVNIQCKYMYT